MIEKKKFSIKEHVPAMAGWLGGVLVFYFIQLHVDCTKTKLPYTESYCHTLISLGFILLVVVPPILYVVIWVVSGRIIKDEGVGQAK